MKILSIDTSSHQLSMAVSEDKNILYKSIVSLNGNLSSKIIKNIERVLEKSKMLVKDLDGFAVGLGPGSFTGLRVGMATIKGLAFIDRKPIVGVSSLDIIAMNVSCDDVPICVLCDAKRDMVYACLYHKKDDRLDKKSDYMLLHVQELLKKVGQKSIFIGDGINLYRKEIQKSRKAIVCVDEKDWYPDAKHIVALTYANFKKRRTNKGDQLVPLYLYPEDCQVRK